MRVNNYKLNINNMVKLVKCILSKRFWNYMIDSYKFFERKSQFYILGNWKKFITDKKAIKDYNRRYLRAYIRFMKYVYIDFKLQG